MTERSAAVLARTLWVTGVVMAATVVTLYFFNPFSDEKVVNIVAPIMSIGYLTVGTLIAARQHRSPIGWLFMTTALGLILSGLGDNVVGTARARGGFSGIEWVAWTNSLTFVVAFAAIPLALLLFPTGALPSRRWRPVAAVMVVAPMFGLAGYILSSNLVGGEGGRFPNPTAIPSLDGLASAFLTIAGVGSILAGLACVAALIVRFRRSRGEERQQLRWLAYAAGFSALCLVLVFTVGFITDNGEGTVSSALFVLFIVSLGVGIPAASGIAILKYRLYDLDVVVKKTVVFAMVGAVLTGLYLLVVLAIPALIVGIGAGAGFSPVQFVAIIVVALAVNPIRTRARRLADRLVYGKRATPYEVLSEFSERLGGTYSTEDVLPRMVKLISEGTGARRAEAWLRVGDQLRLESSWPTRNESERMVMVGEELPAFDGERAFPVTHQGEVLGALVVSMPPSDPLTPDQEKLLRDLAAQAGLVLRNVALTAVLRARLEDLRASRQRLVAAQDEERRRLERNIHDGAQQQLVAIGVKLGLARTLVDRDPAAASEMLEALRQENQQALDDLRDLARGIYPPLLADQGLVVALQAQARKSALPVMVSSDAIGRFSQDVEAAVYFCTLEALQNVAKYAHASRATVTLSASDGHVAFTVTDDGAGFDTTTTSYGTGLQGMADRLAALGGAIEVTSRPGHGTTVTGRVPVGTMEPVG
ncbi:MAG TPA: GAF domain-containing sensor histidine kinase [Actinomycetota bacterium]|nr:GAF domain-containing sensor histidine kinase [Actinomycetota bacterium]